MHFKIKSGVATYSRVVRKTREQYDSQQENNNRKMCISSANTLFSVCIGYFSGEAICHCQWAYVTTMIYMHAAIHLCTRHTDIGWVEGRAVTCGARKELKKLISLIVYRPRPQNSLITLMPILWGKSSRLLPFE